MWTLPTSDILLGRCARAALRSLALDASRGSWERRVPSYLRSKRRGRGMCPTHPSLEEGGERHPDLGPCLFIFSECPLPPEVVMKPSPPGGSPPIPHRLVRRYEAVDRVSFVLRVLRRQFRAAPTLRSPSRATRFAFTTRRTRPAGFCGALGAGSRALRSARPRGLLRMAPRGCTQPCMCTSWPAWSA